MIEQNIESAPARSAGVAANEPLKAYGKRARVQPLVALRALKRLIDDPERTDEVFTVIRALAGSSMDRGLQRFRRLPVGRQILAERRVLLDTLLDREALAQHPRGSLADTYLTFVREGNISADGLVEASESEGREQFESADHQLFGERLRDQHDLWHTLTGYGRDTLGEVCLLAFTYAQDKNRGIGAMALVGMFKISETYGRGVYKAVWRAFRDGKRARWLPGQDWESLLAQPIDTVRENLNLTAPERYTELREFTPLPA